jgi:ATP phosphoribosyltransferase regulatory subunit HisZ
MQTSKETTMSANATYLAAMEKQMKKWDADVDALAAAGEKAAGEARTEYARCVKELRSNRAATQQTFKEMQAAGQAAGAKVQAQLQSAFDAMQKNYKKAVADLKK